MRRIGYLIQQKHILRVRIDSQIRLERKNSYEEIAHFCTFDGYDIGLDQPGAGWQWERWRRWAWKRPGQKWEYQQPTKAWHRWKRLRLAVMALPT